MAFKRVTLVGPEIAGFLLGIESGLAAQGVTCQRILTSDSFGYRDFNQRSRSIRTRRTALGKRVLLAAPWVEPAVRLARKWFRTTTGVIKVVKIARSSDCVIYNFGVSITGTEWEYSFLKRHGLKLIFVFHGSEVRPAYLSGVYLPDDGKPNFKQLRSVVDRQKERVRMAETYGDIRICWLGITHLFSKPVYLHEHMGFPLWVLRNNQEHSVPEALLDSPPIALHAPSSPHIKGTVRIQAAVDSLNAEGIELKYVHISQVSAAQVQQEIHRSDFVIDQILSDTASGVFAAEASIQGRAVLVAGPDAVWIRSFLGDDAPPTNFVCTDDFLAELRRLTLDRDYRICSGLRAKRYFSKRWRPDVVAGRYLELLAGSSRDASPVDPVCIDHPRGGYAEPAGLRLLVKGFVEHWGDEALALEHNSALKRKVIERYCW